MLRYSALLALSLTCLPADGYAADEAWLQERYNIVVRDQDLRGVLEQFGSLVSVPVVISDSVEGRASARFENATGEQVIDSIATEYGLDWRFDGRRIEISANSEQVSRILDMDGVQRSTLVEALEALDSYEPRFPISVADDELGLIVGPPRYVAIVEIVLAELVEKRRTSRALDAERRAVALAREEEKRAAEEARRLAEEERLRALEMERLRAFLNRPAPKPVMVKPDVPVVIRGGRWGG
jgi:type II secretory pathway component GspD/PulD (secretin)